MFRQCIALAFLAAVQGCQQPAPATGGKVWRASEDNGDKPSLGYELRRDGGKVSGDAYILDPDHPHDFSHGRHAAMTVVDETPTQITFHVRWGVSLKATLRFTFKQAEWPDSFQATVAEINGTQEYEADTYTFNRVK
jgi:hypothetical protein